MDELARKTPTTLHEFKDKADDFINVEDTLRALTTPIRSEKERSEDHVKKGTLKRDRDGSSKTKKGQYEERRETSKRANYPRTYGHRTEDCRALKQTIEEMQNNGELERWRTYFVRAENYAWQDRYKEVFSMGRPEKQPKLHSPITISFGEDDCKGVLYSHDDALIVTMLIANYTTQRILIDNGSLADILLWELYEKMGIGPGRLRPAPMTLKGFFVKTVQPVGSIALPVIVGSSLSTTTTMIDFLVVRTRSAYNTIIGHPTLNAIKAITSTYHLKVKFPTKASIGEVCGE
ncbi:hypothetical protein F2P56_014344 [Juglans regia]|uniref:Reverse transcriptase domain-containing protein n=2 Tax=Juglans regia TaxID=51240 RepID=A0A833XCY8_JUGRE|nr:uncharacterized protein LOC109019625 [Juglans regia]KAF5464252.1 hypothetical protein F2P56_014344 [Juglans regia]